eukprot:COSAG05_NODE_1226_length_5453_cov_6.202279_7_plen_34_part_01
MVLEIDSICGWGGRDTSIVNYLIRLALPLRLSIT